MQNKVEFSERDFFKDPLNRSEILELLGEKPAEEMFNFRSPSFRKLGLSRDNLGKEDLIALMLKEPRLVRRPVVRIAQKVYFGADRSAMESLIGMDRS